MEFPVVFPSGERDFTAMGLAVLHNAKNVKIKQVINGDYTLSFVLPRCDDWLFIKEENIVYVDGQPFRIRSFDEIRDSTGKIMLNISCEHVCYDLNDIKHLPSMRDIVNATAMEIFWDGYLDSFGVLNQGIIRNSDFSFFSEVDGSVDLFLSKCNPRGVLKEFLEKLECEVLFDNFSIRLVNRIGNENGPQFRVGKNLLSIKRKTDSSGLCTRLYPYGKDYLDITSVNENKAYLDSPLIENYDYPHEDYRDYSDIDAPADIKVRALKEFSTDEKDGIDKPKVSYEISVVELKKINEFASMERFSLGDTVRVIDEQLGIDVNSRIVEYEFYPYEPNRSTVVLSNFKENLGGVFADIVKNQNIIKDITNSKGEVRDAYVESVRSTVSMKFNQSLTKKTVVYDYANMWVDDFNNPTSAIALVDGKFAMANSKTVDGLWNWRTIGDSSGLVADSVVSNWVYAGKVSASQLDAGIISTDLITIQSSSGNLKITSNNIEMSAYDGSSMNLNPSNGLSIVHKKNSFNYPLEETKLDANGLYKQYKTYDASGNLNGFSKTNYIDAIYAANLGGGTWDPFLMRITLNGPQWRSNKVPKVIVTPNEVIRFVTDSGGRVGDFKDYACSSSIVYYGMDGVIIDVHAEKTYVERISLGSPVWGSKSLAFSILVVLI